MFYYLIIKNVINTNIIEEIEETLQKYYGNIILKEDKNNGTIFLVVKSIFDKNTLPEFFNMIFNDHLIKGLVYISENYNNDNLNEDITVINKLIEEHISKIDMFVINQIDLFKYTKNLKTNNHLRSLILKNYADDSEMINTLNIFFECNLNSLSTSKVLNVHRNTLQYRLDKFHKTTGLDPRSFNDAIIIKSLL